MRQFTCHILKLIGALALLLYVVVCLGVLGVRYWILPHIDDWRPQIEQYVSQRFKTDIGADHIQAAWAGLVPRISLIGVTIAPAGAASGPGSDNAAQNGSLRVSRLDIRLDWRSLLHLRPVFLDLRASGIVLDLRRDEQGKLHVLGQTIDFSEQDARSERLLDFLRWLGGQRRITLDNATVRWTDETRGPRTLTLNEVRVVVANQGDQHNISVSAIPPSELGALIDARATLALPGGIGKHASEAASDRAQPSEAGQDRHGASAHHAERVSAGSLPPLPAKANGRIYLRLKDIHPAAWAPWITPSESWTARQMDVHAVLTLTGTENNRLTTDIRMAAPRWHPTENLTIDGDALHLYLDGPARGYAHLAQGHRVGKLAGPVSQVVEKQSGGSRVLNYRLIGQGVRIIDPHTFPQPIALQHIMGQGQMQREDNGQLRISASQMFVANTDAQARLKGWWSQGGGSLAGLADITGTVDYARVAAIGDYLPEHINKLAREWMSQALTQGVIKDAELTLRGNLRHFPFQDQPETGDFRIAGAFSDTTIDYLPPHGNEKGWPAVEDMQGRALLHRADLRLDIDHAIMRPAPGQVVQVTRLAARIPDLEHDPILDISGETEGGATAYLGLMTHSPLGQLLGNVFDDTRASGDWQVPLALTIPLTHASDTQVDGAIHFQGNTLHLMPGVPAFEQMQGVLAFTQDGATAQGIKGTVLGGAMKMDGTLGGQGKGLRMRGTLTAKALSSYAAIKAVDRLKGQAAYTAILQRKTDAAAILTVRTDMRGISADMPRPLSKSAAESLKVKAVWAPQRKGSGRLLAMQIGRDVDIRLLHREGASDQPFFQAGALGIHAHPDLPAKGLNIEARFTDVNLDEWNALRRELGQPSDGASGTAAKQPPGDAHAKPATGQPFMPALARLRLQSDTAQFHGMALDQLTFTILQPEPGQWRADVSASTTAGTIRWQEHHGQLQGPIRADFNRLALGNAPEKLATHPAKTASHSADAPEQEKKSMPLDLDQGLDLPPISLRVQDLALYGRHVGALSLTARAESHGTRWRLDNILLNTPEAQLNGQGAWQLTGPQRGLSLKAAATVQDMGAYMDRIQYKDILSGGKGTLAGEFKWKNIPWSFKREDLSGTLDIALDKGRFSNLNSYSARLLELLSLQSVKRLARLNFSPGSLLREGFPFDTLRGTLVASDGVLSTHDYRVIGPAGTIVLEGDTNLVDETLNMQAVVVPDLDASGAAIAAGIAINPIVGIGAFLAQLFLQAPLSEAMTAQYHITGTWEEPKVEETTPPAKDRVPDKEPPP